MTEHHDFAFSDLEMALTSLARRVDFPPTPDLASAVLAAIGSQSAPLRQPAPTPWYRTPRWLAAAACVVLLGVAGLLAVFPDVRSSIAKRLGLPGIEIIVVDETATAVPTVTGSNLLLGDQVSLDEARGLVDYPIQIPSELGEPDEVYVRDLSSGPMVTLLYLPREDLPNTAESGVGALLMQFPATDHPAELSKRVSMGIGRVLEVTIGSEEAYWVTGETQLVLDQDPSDTFEDLVARDSGDVLIWRSGGTTFRLESALKLNEALSVANSIPAGDGTATP